MYKLFFSLLLVLCFGFAARLTNNNRHPSFVVGAANALGFSNTNKCEGLNYRVGSSVMH